MNCGETAVDNVEAGEILGWACGRVDQGDAWVVCRVG